MRPNNLPKSFSFLFHRFVRPKMEIVFHIIVGSWIFVTLIKADCVFPGLPKNGYGRQIINGALKDIEWNTEFAEESVLLYGCTDGFKMKMFEDRQITCTGGQWNGLVPKCCNVTQGYCDSITYCKLIVFYFQINKLTTQIWMLSASPRLNLETL